MPAASVNKVSLIYRIHVADRKTRTMGTPASHGSAFQRLTRFKPLDPALFYRLIYIAVPFITHFMEAVSLLHLSHHL